VDEPLPGSALRRTQVGGKYHPDDDTVFRIKRVLVRLDIAVSHPIADEIKSVAGDHGYAISGRVPVWKWPMP
jgi:hypothetical protein